MHCNDLLSRLRACLAAALLAAALVWLTAAAFLPEESCLLPVLTAAAAAVTMAFWRRRVWLAPALWLGACAVTAAVFWRAAVSGVAALANGVLDAWKHLHAGNPELFAVAEERGAALLLCMLGALLGVWLAALIVKKLGFERSIARLLDAFAPGAALAVAFIRLSALFNSSCRSKIAVTTPVTGYFSASFRSWTPMYSNAL